MNTQREANEMVIALQEEERVVEEMAVLQLYVRLYFRIEENRGEVLASL